MTKAGYHVHKIITVFTRQVSSSVWEETFFVCLLVCFACLWLLENNNNKEKLTVKQTKKM